MQVLMRGNRVGVQKIGKDAKNSNFLAVPEAPDALGIVKYVGPEVKDIQVGMQVYYGSRREQIRIGDADIQVMEEENIFAIRGDQNEEVTKKEQ